MSSINLSNNTFVDDITLTYDQAVVCFVEEEPGKCSLDQDHVIRLTTSLCSQVAQDKFKAVAVSLYNIEEHIRKLRERVKNCNQLEEALPLIISKMIDGLIEDDKKSDCEKRVRLLKKLMGEVRELRKTDFRFGKFPVTPDDLYAKIWSLIPLEEKRAIFPGAGVPLQANTVRRQATIIPARENSLETIQSSSYLDVVQNNPWEVKSPADNPYKPVHRVYGGGPKFRLDKR